MFVRNTPARSLNIYLLSSFLMYGERVPRTTLDRVLAFGKDPVGIGLADPPKHKTVSPGLGDDGVTDSLRFLLYDDNFNNVDSLEHELVRFLTRF